MIFIFLSGALGFFVFDAYRVYKFKMENGYFLITFRHITGLLVHFLVYAACGIIAVFVSLDVLIECCEFSDYSAWSDELVGSVMRGFAIGLAGPAGLSKGQARLASAGDEAEAGPPTQNIRGGVSRTNEAKLVRVETLRLEATSASTYLRILLMR